VYVLQTIQKFTSQNLVNQPAVFHVRNALKVVYEHLRFENFFLGVVPGTRVKSGGRTWGEKERTGREGKGREGKGREGKEVVPPRFNLVPHRFHWASYGPEFISALRMCN
jgi:hypothetical protein